MVVTRTVIFMSISFQMVCGFNLDTNFPIKFSRRRGDFFGYTTALHYNADGYYALVGAPRSNSTFLHNTKQPGVIFKCKIDTDKDYGNCSEIVFELKGNAYGTNDEGHRYHSYKQGMWLGASLDVRQSSENNDIVACGHLWKDQIPLHQKIYGHRPNGICYVIDKDFDRANLKILLPLVDIGKQNHVDYFYAAGQAGMSAAYSEDSDHLFIGAPGIVYWKGSIIRYFPAANYKSPDVLQPPLKHTIEYNSNTGYSITSGNFFEGKSVFVAAGAPRASKNFGAVYIVEMKTTRQKYLTVLDTKEGQQFGEYFGYSVLGTNLNGDPFTDLVVGAPFNSPEKNSADKRGDEGKAYVYISNGVALQMMAELTGDNVPNSRFGSAIGNIGDINLDGFNDVAIGAPEENEQGAVYIYHGSRSGIKTEYAQKIFASDVLPGLSGFGMSISRSLDIDGNEYPDVLVGSLYSSDSILLRANPVIRTQASIVSTPLQINANVSSCELLGETLACVKITACLWLTGSRISRPTNFESEIIIESLGSVGHEHRGFFYMDSKKSLRWKEQQQVDFEITKCITSNLYIDNGVKDLISPITALYRFEVGPYAEDKFEKFMPVLDPSSVLESSATIPFQTGCATDGKCHSDIMVEFNIVKKENGEKFLVGRDKSLLLEVKVTNNGEPAYFSELFIHLPDHIHVISQELCISSEQQMDSTLICDLGNPLMKETPVLYLVKLDVSKVPTSVKEQVIKAEAKTISDDINPLDNKVEIPLYFEAVATVALLGSSSQEQVIYDAFNTTGNSVITHTYTIRNHGPSPVKMVDFMLRVPVAFIKENKRITFTEKISTQTVDGKEISVAATCKDSVSDMSLISNPTEATQETKMKRSANPENVDVVPIQRSKKIEENEITNKDFKIISCDTEHVECRTIHCSASPFKNTRGAAVITVFAEINITVLNQYLKRWFAAKFITTGEIFLKDQSIDRYAISNITSVETTIVNESPMPPEKVAWWIIIVSITFGVLLLILILVALIRCGFFKRKEKEQMEFMKKALTELHKPENQEVEMITDSD